MRTLKKVIADIHEEAKQNTDFFEATINDNTKRNLNERFISEHPYQSYELPDHDKWIQNRSKYINKNFQPIKISAEDKEKITKNFVNKTYINIARRNLTHFLIAGSLIFSMASCTSCLTSPEYNASEKQKSEQNSLYGEIRNAEDFIWHAKLDSAKQVSYTATPEEFSMIQKRIEKLTNYKDSIRNDPNYSIMEEASDSRERKGWYHFLSGIVGAISLGTLSGLAGNLTEKRTRKKNNDISSKYLLGEGDNQ